jgi:hypothetical protein
MPYINPRVYDFGLNVLDTEANRLDICHTEPTTYAQATSTYTVANKTSLDVGSPTDEGTGRKVTVAAISTGGSITATSTSAADDAEFWAVTDTANSRLLATGTLTAGQMVTSGNTFTLAAFPILINGLP